MDPHANNPAVLATAPSADAALRAAENLAEHLSKMLTLAETFIQQRRRVDVTGLDERVGRLCAAALDLPVEQGRAIRPVLMHLHERIGALSTALAITGAEP